MAPTPRFDCANVDPSPLARPLPFTFSGRVAPNRILKGAMSEHLASFSLKIVEERGMPSRQLVQAYKNWGNAEIGMNLTGNIMVDPNHLEAAGNAVISRNEPFFGKRFELFQEIAAAGKANGSLLVAQIGHPGRQTPMEVQPHPISASAIQLKANTLGRAFGNPRAATIEDINYIVDCFAHAAEFLDKAGFDGVELHGAHGYLISQFLSPTTNLRDDQYGGDLKNRMRLIHEIKNEISKRVRKDFIVGIKINSVEFQKDGLQPDEAKEVCRALEDWEFDFVELSGGTYENWGLEIHKRQSTLEREAFFLQFAKLIVPALTKTKVYVTGGLRTVEGMVKALETVDGIGLGRALCQEPDLCRHILSGAVKGAMLQKLDLQDFGATAGVAGVQITQIGHDMQPINLCLEDNVAKVFGALGEWMAANKDDVELCGFPVLEGYNVPYSSQETVI
ncbi:hypothetical protein PENCOP_c003G05051 [Penicillium coprophilum]|uniref:NADH:flavin oxidoreductase/NADH oxidase N-terminal domain-containing protein n=1 Tax=Penicillium coprophilum TaxID=36646 RepID=A0A1V6UYS9_9EURO|nr:hypothetical protein PENCOP_c003G05051 [Penicillium coprophilum]